MKIPVLVIMLACAAPLASISPGHVRAQDAKAKPLATRELDVDGVVAEVIESDRKEGVLTVRVRLRNTGDKPKKVLLVRGGQSYEAAYLSARDTKYTLITDTSQRVVATPTDGGGWLEPSIKPKGTWHWWGKFVAPPADVKRYTLYLKVGPPIEDVPIVDRN
jgi:hypothetical protein